MNAILPLLNKFVPIGIAMKGIEKLNPKVKNFITGATAAGYSTDYVFDYLRNKIENPNYVEHQESLDQGAQQGTLRPDEAASRQRIKQQEQVPNAIQTGAGLAAGGIGGALGALGSQSPTQQQQPTQPMAQNPNIVNLPGMKPGMGNSPPPGQQSTPPTQQNTPPTAPNSPRPGGFESLIKQYPELGKFLDEEIHKNGASPAEAATKARSKKFLSGIVKKIEENVGQPFEDLLNQFFQNTPQQEQYYDVSRGKPTQNGQKSPGSGKDQFLQGLNKMSEMIAGMKRR